MPTQHMPLRALNAECASAFIIFNFEAQIGYLQSSPFHFVRKSSGFGLKSQKVYHTVASTAFLICD